MLFKTIAEFGIVDANTNFSKFSKYISDAQDQYILKVLGAAQYAALDAAYMASTMDAAQTALLEKVQPALRNMTMYIAMPKMNLRISDLGVMKSASADFDAATGGEIYFARVQYLIDGFRAIDTLYKFLEDNKADYADWTGSDEYMEFKKFFVNSAAIFSKHTGAPENRWLLSRLFAQMENVELLQIQSAIGKDFFTYLKSAFEDDDLEEEEEDLIKLLEKPISLYTYAAALVDPNIQQLIRIMSAVTADDLSNKGTPSENYKEEFRALSARKEAEADAFLKQVKDYLNENASDTIYLIYYSSDYYTNPNTTTKTILPNYNNDTSDTSFSML